MAEGLLSTGAGLSIALLSLSILLTSAFVSVEGSVAATDKENVANKLRTVFIVISFVSEEILFTDDSKGLLSFPEVRTQTLREEVLRERR